MEFLRDDIDSPIGPLVLLAREGRMWALGFSGVDSRTLSRLEAHGGPLVLTPKPDPEGFSGLLRRYFDGDLPALDLVAVETLGTPFQREAWSELRRVKAGETISYAELARRLGRPLAVRAAGLANAQNPIPLVIPCHRVIGKDGSLTGYGGGLEKKRWLLSHEAAELPLFKKA